MKKILLFALMVIVCSCSSKSDTAFAAIGTITNVRDRLDLDAESNGSVLCQMLIPFSASKEPQY